MEGFLHYRFGGLILILEGLTHGGAYFQNFTVFSFIRYTSDMQILSILKQNTYYHELYYEKVLTSFANTVHYMYDISQVT